MAAPAREVPGPAEGRAGTPIGFPSSRRNPPAAHRSWSSFIAKAVTRTTGTARAGVSPRGIRTLRTRRCRAAGCPSGRGRAGLAICERHPLVPGRASRPRSRMCRARRARASGSAGCPPRRGSGIAAHSPPPAADGLRRVWLDEPTSTARIEFPLLGAIADLTVEPRLSSWRSSSSRSGRRPVSRRWPGPRAAASTTEKPSTPGISRSRTMTAGPFACPRARRRPRRRPP